MDQRAGLTLESNAASCAQLWPAPSALDREATLTKH